MPPKIVEFGTPARRSILTALKLASRLVRPTLGPDGRAVLSQTRPDQAPHFLTTGLEILKELESSNRSVNAALQILRDAVQKLYDSVGDGTATAVVLTEVLFASALRHVEAGFDPLELYARLRKESAPALAEIERAKLSMDSSERMRRLMLGSDPHIAALIGRVLEPLTCGAAVIVEESTRIESTVKLVEGFHLAHGYVSAHLVNRPETSQVMMERPAILVYEPAISDVRLLAAFLERAAALRRPALIFTSDIDADSIATLVVNRMRQTIEACAVRVRSEELREDLAAFTGATLIRSSMGISLDRITPNLLGEAERAVVDADSTTLMNGKGDVSPLVSRLKRRLEVEDVPLMDRDAIQERLARLSGKLVQCFAGGASRFEMQHQRMLLKGAVNAIRSAIQGGAVPGAGASWIAAARKTTFLRDALTAPVAQVLANSGAAVRPTIEKLLKRGIETDVLDPWPVVRGALATAVSLSGTFLGCEAIVTEQSGSKDVFIPPNIEEAERARRAMKRV
jgi:chaperonin GroEL